MCTHTVWAIVHCRRNVDPSNPGNWIESGDLCDWNFGFNTADQSYLQGGKLFNVQTATGKFLSQTIWVSTSRAIVRRVSIPSLECWCPRKSVHVFNLDSLQLVNGAHTAMW